MTRKRQSNKRKRGKDPEEEKPEEKQEEEKPSVDKTEEEEKKEEEEQEDTMDVVAVPMKTSKRIPGIDQQIFDYYDSLIFGNIAVKIDKEAIEQSTLTTLISKPHPHDILSGRGNGINSHPGNQYFQLLVKHLKNEYVTTPKPEKPLFAKLIVKQIQALQPPGRFLKKEKDCDFWYEIGENKALIKTRQALREDAEKKNVTMQSGQCAPATNVRKDMTIKCGNENLKALSTNLVDNNSKERPKQQSLVLSHSEKNCGTLFNSPSARPLCGVISKAAGYTLVHVSSEERTVRVSERLTAEAVACHLSVYPPAEPLFYVPSPGDQSRSLPFLPSNSDKMRDGPGSKVHVKYLNPSLYFSSPKEGVSEVERSKQCVVSAVLQLTEVCARKNMRSDDSEHATLTHDDFILLPSSSPTTNRGYTFTNPLYVETATQLGLMKDKTIPNLVNHLVPNSAPLPTRRFLRRWLLTPPPPAVAESMAKLISTLKVDILSLPPMIIRPIGKVLSLIREGQASVRVFRDILTSIESSVSILNTSVQIVPPLMTILRYESGIDSQDNNLKERCLEVIQIIESVVCTHDQNDMKSNFFDNISSDGDGIVPPTFFARNEISWRGRIKPENAKEAYGNVRNAARNLVETIAVDFWGAGNPNNMSSAMEVKSLIVQDIFNNLIALKQIPPWATDKKEKYYHPRDRNGKLLCNRYTTARVEDAVSAYVNACNFAAESIHSVLSKLSKTLYETGHLPVISQAAHINLILSTATQHAAHANYLGWHMAEIVDRDNENNKNSFEFRNVWPYWMDKSECVLNSFTLDGMFILTAPNMSGKSTIMRSAAAAALLTNSGLCAPLEKGSRIPRFDNIFVRGASSDIPSENKSAFGAEMQDIAALLRACGDQSLVFVDELGRGTSPTDGALIAGAVLEVMSERGMKGIFATHLHSILELPLTKKATANIVKKTMETSKASWTYKIVDGVCTDSMAFRTAAKFGIPERIIQRAMGLSSHSSCL